MDDQRFDALAKLLAGSPSRRRLLRAAVGAAVGAVAAQAAPGGATPALAATCRTHADCGPCATCGRPPRRGAPRRCTPKRDGTACRDCGTCRRGVCSNPSGGICDGRAGACSPCDRATGTCKPPVACRLCEVCTKDGCRPDDTKCGPGQACCPTTGECGPKADPCCVPCTSDGACCPAGRACIDPGPLRPNHCRCDTATQTPCGRNGDGTFRECCTDGEAACLGGKCCPAARVCGDTCCPEGQRCDRTTGTCCLVCENGRCCQGNQVCIDPGATVPNFCGCDININHPCGRNADGTYRACCDKATQMCVDGACVDCPRPCGRNPDGSFRACCPADQTCVGGQCQPDPCPTGRLTAAGVCCATPQQVCRNQIGEFCCAAGTECCRTDPNGPGRCCKPGRCASGECCPDDPPFPREVCNGVCCVEGKICCGGQCCSPLDCVNGTCCPSRGCGGPGCSTRICRADTEKCCLMAEDSPTCPSRNRGYGCPADGHCCKGGCCPSTHSVCSGTLEQPRCQRNVGAIDWVPPSPGRT